jgi:alpha-beta hydrolase superfamily lysophospholipase
LPRAAFWLSQGWSVLLVDLRGTGESDPRAISFGWNERLDVDAWVTRMRERGVRTIALHGQSLGAAAAVYAVADGAEVQLLVLDACYDDVQRALDRRLPFVPFPRLAFFPVRLLVELRTGIAAEQLRPIDKLSAIRAPTFFAVGTDDQKVGREAATDLFEASPAAHKQLFWVEAARHEELWARHADQLSPALTAFLNAAGLR